VWTVEWFWRGILKLKTLSLNLTYSPSIIWSRKVIPTTLNYTSLLWLLNEVSIMLRSANWTSSILFYFQRNE
jgi:hypothetical protein